MKKIDIDLLLESTRELKANMKDLLVKKIEIDKVLENTQE
jgi:hypothetical protein